MLFVFFSRQNIDNGLNVPFQLLCVERAFPSWLLQRLHIAHRHTCACVHTHTTVPHRQITLVFRDMTGAGVGVL